MRLLGCHLRVRPQPISGAGGGAFSAPGGRSLCLAQWSGEQRRIGEFSASSAGRQPGLTRPCPTAPEFRVCSAPARPAMGSLCRSLSAILFLLQVLGVSRLPAGRLPALRPASPCLSACCHPSFLLPRKLGFRGPDLPGGCAALWSGRGVQASAEWPPLPQVPRWGRATLRAPGTPS